MIEAQGETADLGVELLEGEELPLGVDLGVFGVWFGALRKASERGELLGIVAFDLGAGTGDGKPIE